MANAYEPEMRTCIKSGLVLGPAKKQKIYEVNGIVAPPVIGFPYISAYQKS